MGRAPCCDKANVKKGPWSPEEDAKLKSYIEQHGTGGNWISLPQKIGLTRCGKSCRLRWLNYLRPNIKHGGFSEEEDRIICSLYVSIGSRWSIIAAQLPGRTDNDIKNYWNTRLKKKLFGKHHRNQPLVRRGRKTNSKIGNHPTADHFHSQSPYLPGLLPAISSPPPPPLSYPEAPPLKDNDCIRNLLNKLGGRFSRRKDPFLQPPSPFPPDSQQVYTPAHIGAQNPVHGAAQEQSHHVEEFENFYTEAFDSGLQFFYGEDYVNNEYSNGMVSNCDWGEMSSLISAPSYYSDQSLSTFSKEQ